MTRHSFRSRVAHRMGTELLGRVGHSPPSLLEMCASVARRCGVESAVRDAVPDAVRQALNGLDPLVVWRETFLRTPADHGTLVSKQCYGLVSRAVREIMGLQPMMSYVMHALAYDETQDVHDADLQDVVPENYRAACGRIGRAAAIRGDGFPVALAATAFDEFSPHDKRARRARTRARKRNAAALQEQTRMYEERKKKRVRARKARAAALPEWCAYCSNSAELDEVGRPRHLQRCERCRDVGRGDFPFTI